MNNSKYILIVDDNPHNLKLLGNTLQHEGYKLAAAMSGDEALEILESSPVDLILLDVMMPGTDGFETCQKIKKNKEWAEIPVIFITALNDIQNLVRAFDSGGADYITKPFQQRELLARVKTHIELRTIHQELQNTIIARDKLYSLVAHDIRSPLATIITLMEGLETTPFESKEFYQLIEELNVTTRETFEMLEDLLIWAKNQIGTIQPNKEVVVVEEVVQELIPLLERQTEKKDIELIHTFPPNFTLLVDRKMFKTVLRNLVSNSIKFTPKGGEIKIMGKLKGQTSSVEIIDTGIGMTAEISNQLKENTNYWSTTGTEGEKGSGLGLKLCSEFIRKNSGELDIDSIPGCGTNFKILFPTLTPS
jgi:DNA-binding response OmpR family regulator